MPSAAAGSAPDDEEVLRRMAPIIAESLRIEAGQVTLDTSLADLGAESLDLVQINLDVETEFDIYLPDKDILSTAQELFGPGVLTKDGEVTATGRDLLLARMPELAAAELPDPLPLAVVERLFLRVDVWVRLVRQLIELRREQLASGPADAPPQPADEWNRRWVEGYIRERFPDGLPQAAPAEPA